MARGGPRFARDGQHVPARHRVAGAGSVPRRPAHRRRDRAHRGTRRGRSRCDAPVRRPHEQFDEQSGEPRSTCLRPGATRHLPAPPQRLRSTRAGPRRSFCLLGGSECFALRALCRSRSTRARYRLRTDRSERHHRVDARAGNRLAGARPCARHPVRRVAAPLLGRRGSTRPSLRGPRRSRERLAVQRRFRP